MKGKKPSRVVIDFNVYPKLGEALKTHVSNINEGRYAPRYSSIAQFIIELIERELAKSISATKSTNNDVPPESFFS